MMQPVSRKGDLCVGWCSKHGLQMGIIISGNYNSLVGNLPNARVTDKVKAFCCGATGTIVVGNPTSLDKEMPSARIGDSFVGQFSGTIIQGHPQTLS